MQRLGSFRFDSATLVLTRAGAIVPASPKTMELLALLARTPSAVVTLSELRAQLWPSEAVEERNLSQQVYLLRGVLAADAEVRIENVPRRGYRLVVPDRPEAAAAAFGGRTLTYRRLTLTAVLALLFASTGGAASHRPLGALPRDAATAYERGRLMWERRNLPSLSVAERYFRTTVALAPNDPRGYAGLAAVEAIRGNLAREKRLEHASFRRSQRFAEAALARDPNSADALTVKALVLEFETQDFARAEALFRRAQYLDPHNAYAHVWLGIALIDAGRLADARVELERGEELAPGSKTAARWLGEADYSAHAFDAASVQFRSVLEIDPSDEETIFELAQIDEVRREYARGIARLRRAGPLVPRDKRLTMIARLEALRGRRREALRELARVGRWSDVDPVELAATQLALGRSGTALAMLRDAVKKGDRSVRRSLRWDPRFAALRRLTGARELGPIAD